MTVRTLVVGSSLSPSSDAVVKDALALARALGAKLRVVHAFSPPIAYAGEAAPGYWLDPELLARREGELRGLLAAQVARCGVRDDELDGLALSTLPAARLLVEAARESSAELVVVGAREKGHLLGSTAERVLRLATTPVFIRRAPLRLPLRSVLLPVDLSPRAADALRTGVDFLGQLGRGAAPAPRIEVLFVLLDFAGLLPTQFTPAQVHDMAERELRTFVEAAAPGQAVDCRVRVGEVVPEILGELDGLAADLAVLCTHGRGGFERFLLGSVAESLARTAKCNLLVVPPAERQRQRAAA